MTPGLTSIVIPTYNHAPVVVEAVVSALKQTAPVEVIVVDDGSTDDTAEIMRGDVYLALQSPEVRYLRIPHGGPSRARNVGLEAARGEFVMFLDADDQLEPEKVAIQARAFDDAVGWVICDVLIDDEARGPRLASDQYRYAQRNLGGWIREQLAISNFIPVMAPLVRRSVLGDIRFSETLTPEDWHVWYAVAGVARVRYVPDVLATYRKRRHGRHVAGLPSRPPSGPCVLNLGCGTPGAASWHPVPGAINLDRSLGWMFEDGLGQFADGSVAGITISHALMYVHEMDWLAVFHELARVLERGGVLRITEDETADPRSGRYLGWRGSEPAVTLTTPALVRTYLEAAGLEAVDVDAVTTRYRDGSLRQAQHGAPPNVFFIEGIKP